MINFFSLKTSSFGLSISDSAVKIANLEKKGRFLKLSSWGEFFLEKGAIEEGEIKNEDIFAKQLNGFLIKIKGEKLKTKNVIISLPEKKAFFTIIQMPKMKKEELDMAVPFEVENYVPFSAEEIYSDFQIIKPLKNSLDHLDILVGVIPKKIVDPYVNCVKKAGLFPSALEIEPQSICRSLIKKEISPFPVLIIDFEEDYTNLIIFSGYSIRFAFSMPISSFQLNQAVSKSLNIDLKEAEKMKIKHGLQINSNKDKTKDKETAKKVSEAMIPILSDLAGQIKKYIGYYQTHSEHQHLIEKSQSIEKIIVCGKEANLKGLISFLSFSLNMPLEIANPWINILPEPLKEVPDMSFEESLGYAAPLGLALRGIKGE